MDMDKHICIICGMTINDKNYNFNNNAFEEKNTLNDIKYCPFCGVGKDYIYNEEKAQVLNKKIEGLDKDILKIIDHACKLEVFNGEFYKQASILASDSKIKEMFKDLSNIELMHAKVHKAIAGLKELPKLREMDYSKYDSDELLLQMANKREQHAVQYYSKYYEAITLPEIRKVFDAFTTVEKEHINLTI